MLWELILELRLLLLSLAHMVLMKLEMTLIQLVLMGMPMKLVLLGMQGIMLLEMILELILGMKKDETGASGNDDPFIDAGETEEAGTGETDAPSAADYAATYATDGPMLLMA
jgi:hypothetical protein